MHNAPSLTIEAKWNRPVRVKWINDLRDPGGDFLPTCCRSIRRSIGPTHRVEAATAGPGSTTPDLHRPAPIVTHVHGAVGVADDSDGYTEACICPRQEHPGGLCDRRHLVRFRGQGREQLQRHLGTRLRHLPAPNKNRASTIWYHDHTLGMTRLNVYAGPAGFYLSRGPAGDDEVDSSTGATVLPGPAPRENDKFPPNKTYYEIPIAIQDRSFNTDGSLFYPATRAFFDEIAGPQAGHRHFTDLEPGVLRQHDYGEWQHVAFQTVEQRRYRFRFLNGCNSRFLILDFSPIPRVEVRQIGNEGGFLAAPVNVTAAGNRLLLSPAERADVIVDFTDVPLGDHVLSNVGPDEPFGGGVPGIDFDVADPATTGQVMQFRVVPVRP